MILNAFKEKLNQKYINKLLSVRKLKANNNKIKSIAVLLNADEFVDFDIFRQYFIELNLTSPKHKIIVFTNDDKYEASSWETYYSPKDFGWNGKVKDNDLKLFIEEPYDILISYYKKNETLLNLITAKSEAKFKVGLTNKDERMYDLIIKTEPKNIEVFKSELKKYLNILNKL